MQEKEVAREQLIEALTRFGFDALGEPRVVTEEVIRGLIDELRPIADPEIVCVMVGDAEGSFTSEFDGLDGFADAWTDWLATFERLELHGEEEVLESGETIITLGRQTGVSATAGVEVETEAAAVWMLRDGRLVRVEFHLTRESALRAAGLEPGAA